MSATRKARAVHVVRTYPEAQRRAAVTSMPQRPTLAAVNQQRFALLEDALSGGLQRLADVAEALDELERATQEKMNRFGVLLERYKAAVSRARR